MADVYWLSFRLKDSEGHEHTYDQRRHDLHEQIRSSCGNGNKWWFETSSFYIFQSAEDLDQLVARIKRAIDPDVDLVVLRFLSKQGGRVIGECEDQDIFVLAPHLKKV